VPYSRVGTHCLRRCSKQDYSLPVNGEEEKLGKISKLKSSFTGAKNFTHKSLTNMQKFKGAIEYRKAEDGIVAIVTIIPPMRLPDQAQWTYNVFRQEQKGVYTQTLQTVADAQEQVGELLKHIEAKIEHLRGIVLPEDQTFEI
jgi:hypothetical protein